MWVFLENVSIIVIIRFFWFIGSKNVRIVIRENLDGCLVFLGFCRYLVFKGIFMVMSILVFFSYRGVEGRFFIGKCFFYFFCREV